MNRSFFWYEGWEEYIGNFGREVELLSDRLTAEFTL